MSRRRLPWLFVLLVAAIAAGALVLGREGGGGETRSTVSRAPTASERFANCETNPLTKRLRTINARAERAVARGSKGMDKDTVDAWLRTQNYTNDLLDAIRAHSKQSRYDFMDLAFDDNRGFLIEISMRNDHHTAAILDCAKRLHLFGRVVVSIHRWTPGQLDEASRKLNERLRGKVDDDVFETYRTSGDRYIIEVFRKATKDDIATIEQFAGDIGVGYAIKRSKGDKPVYEPAVG